MEIRRKITCNYLFNQYEKAKKYLEKELHNSSRTESMDIICDRVSRAGIAYAQAKYCVFLNDGGWGEDVICQLNKDNSVIISSLYKSFIDDMNNRIKQMINTAEN